MPFTSLRFTRCITSRARQLELAATAETQILREKTDRSLRSWDLNSDISLQKRQPTWYRWYINLRGHVGGVIIYVISRRRWGEVQAVVAAAARSLVATVQSSTEGTLQRRSRACFPRRCWWERRILTRRNGLVIRKVQLAQHTDRDTRLLTFQNLSTTSIRLMIPIKIWVLLVRKDMIKAHLNDFLQNFSWILIQIIIII